LGDQAPATRTLRAPRRGVFSELARRVISATGRRRSVQTCSQAITPMITPTPPASKVPHSNQRRLVSRAMAAVAMAICSTVVAWAQR
jgi:hypothetical protein